MEDVLNAVDRHGTIDAVETQNALDPQNPLALRIEEHFKPR